VKSKLRIGHGYDIHRLVSGRDLYLCGLKIPFEKGLDGHSDADVALHAVCDSLLGAAALNDIGFYFPPTSPELKGISSLILLERVYSLIKNEGYCVSNIDISIIAEAPKIKPFVAEMKNKIASVLEIDVSQIGIKATTNEGIDQIGQGQAICAHCVCLLSTNS
jgi:2-C-methyl-D-erythritol 2,4-cyclodiphosphate synthase